MNIRRHYVIIAFSSALLLLGLITRAHVVAISTNGQTGQHDAVMGTNDQVTTAGPTTIGWKHEIVSMPGLFSDMSDHSLAFDAGGTVHLVYGGDQLYYATSDGGPWHIEVVDETIGAGQGASLALDGSGRPHIAYRDSVSGRAKYAHWTGGAWIYRDLGGVQGYGPTAIAVDSAGYPHVAYITDQAPPGKPYCNDLGYVRWSGSGWLFERLNTCARHPSLALDRSDRPHVSFYTNERKIKHATKAAGNWTIDAVGDIEHSYASSIAMDGDDRPHIAYVDKEWGGQLIHARWDGATWVLDEIQPALGSVGLSIAFDEAGQGHIAHGNQYIALTENGAASFGADSNVRAFYTSIALDGNRRPAISYLLETGGVFCNRWNGTEWDTSMIDIGGDAGYRNSIALDGNGQPHIGYLNSLRSGDEVLYAYRSGDVWLTEAITASVPANAPELRTVGSGMSLAVDAQHEPHALFGFGSGWPVPLYYGRHVSETWQLEVISEEFDYPATVDVDSLGQPHVVFNSDAGLQYGWRTTGGWHFESDDSISADSPLLKLDSLDQPRLIHRDWDSLLSHRRLSYAVWNGSEWQSETIESLPAEGNWFTSFSLALDETDTPHVSYIVESNDVGVVKYAVLDGDAWTVEVVDDRGLPYVGSSEIALGAAGYLRIAYCADRRLQVAMRDGDDWLVQDAGATSCGNLAAAGNRDAFFISYNNPLGYALMVAERLELPAQAYLALVIGG